MTLLRFVALLGLASLAVAATCSQQYECTTVSNDYNYVSCTSGQCTCKTEYGFSGSATVEDPCACAHEVYWGQGNPYCKECVAPRSITYTNGIPYCVDPVECEAANEEKARAERQKAVVRKLYDNLVYPLPVPIVQTLNVTGIFTENVRGRVMPAGVFEGIEGSVEYFYALATGNSLVTDVFYIDLVSEGFSVSVRVDILFDYAADPSKGNLTETGRFTFNEEGLITNYDLSILRLGKARNLPAVTFPAQIQFLCQSVMTYCPAGTAVEEFEDFDSCVAFMNSIPFGTWDDAETNTVLCRLLHNYLIPVRPVIHCPHVGPTGGGKCIDVPYELFYQSEY